MQNKVKISLSRPPILPPRNEGQSSNALLDFIDDFGFFLLVKIGHFHLNFRADKARKIV